jgi:hypothetical protein
VVTVDLPWYDDDGFWQPVASNSMCRGCKECLERHCKSEWHGNGYRRVFRLDVDGGHSGEEKKRSVFLYM